MADYRPFPKRNFVNTISTNAKEERPREWDASPRGLPLWRHARRALPVAAHGSEAKRTPTAEAQRTQRTVSGRSTELHSAVSPNCIRQGGEHPQRTRRLPANADYKSAIWQSATLRYDCLGLIALSRPRLCGLTLAPAVRARRTGFLLVNGLFSPLLLVALALTAAGLRAQTNGQPSRLAIITESAAFSTVADLLTVEFSAKPQLQVLERAEIEKLYREQQLSVVNRDYVKLGQVLGADGLLFMNLTADGTNRFLSARLVAVKPGVVLEILRTPWPVPDAPGWACWVANHFTPLLPKLSVAAKDAIPISVVNLRSAVRSVEAQELERQLTVLLIERLTREPELFVLERRRMDLLSGEKELQGMGESTFWSGSYLLDGVIDRNGYAKDTVTIHAQLAPPKGGASVPLEVRGRRAAPVEVVNAAVGRVKESLKLKPGGMPWSPEDEAARFLEEAEWALKWDMFPQAQAAAESAWALGRRDMSCALTRIRAAVVATTPDTGEYEPGFQSNLTGDDTVTDAEIGALLRKTPDRVLFYRSNNTFRYLIVHKPPQPEKIAQAQQLLELYLDLGNRMAWANLEATNSWYRLGLDVLAVASQVLQHFHMAPRAQEPVAEQLAAVRAQTRLLADWLSASPAGKDTCWMRGFKNESPVAHETAVRNLPPNLLADTEGSSIQLCKVQWGCFWQERPEETLALYRQLISTPVPGSVPVVGDWIRQRILSADNDSDVGLRLPPLAAWRAEDRSRLPGLWERFRRESLPPWEQHPPKLAAAHPSVPLNPPPQSMPLNPRPPSEAPTWVFHTLRDMLRTNAPYTQPIGSLAIPQHYSKEQAAELQPLLVGYMSNLLYRAQAGSTASDARLPLAIAHARGLEQILQNRLNPPTHPEQTNALVMKTNAPFVPSQQKPPVLAAPTSVPLTTTNVLAVKRFLLFPIEPLKNRRPGECFQAWMVMSHGIRADRLWLEVRYKHGFNVPTPDEGVLMATSNRTASAVLDLRGTSWEMIKHPDAATVPQVPVGSVGYTLPRGFESADWTEFSAVANDALFVSGPDYLRRYDFKSRQWKTQPAPWQCPTRLLATSSRLFAANIDSIFELFNGGRDARVLASCRRKPAATVLDSLDSFEGIQLFPGSDNSLRVVIQKKLYSWDGHDWTAILPDADCYRLDVFEGGTVLRLFSKSLASGLWLLSHEQARPELCLLNTEVPPTHWWLGQQAANFPVKESPPTWNALAGIWVGVAAPALVGSNLFVVVEHSTLENTSGRDVVKERDGRHADLLCLERGLPMPAVVPLRFDTVRGAALQHSGSVDIRETGRQQGETQTWLAANADWLLFGQDALLGAWAIPMAEIKAAINQERARQAKSPPSRP